MLIGDTQDSRRYVIMPAENAWNADADTASRTFSHALARHGLDPAQPGLLEMGEGLPPLRVVDAIDLDAAAVVELTEAQRVQLTARYPGLQVAPEGRLHLLRSRPFEASIRPARLPGRATAATLEVVVLGDDGQPISGADLVVVFSRKTMSGIRGVKTDAQGRFTANLPASAKRVDLVIATPFGNYWPRAAEDVVLAEGAPTRVTLTASRIQDGFEDGLARICRAGRKKDGAKVKVAIIDAGVTPTASMKVIHGLNTTDEPDEAWGDNGSGHGTHVAGIIHRLAPAAELLVYRVFKADSDEALESHVAKAVRDAVDRDCDLINLSLGQTTEPIAMIREIRRARALGCLCVAAAGNSAQAPVEYPARSTYVQAVSACGHTAGWPPTSILDLEAADDPGAQGAVYFANFSNVGPEIDFIAPGSGIISHVSGADRGVMSGTSMASPAVAGAIARLLSADRALLEAERDQQRSDDIAKLAFEHADAFGFGVRYEGKGVLP
jgi:subtilisin